MIRSYSVEFFEKQSNVYCRQKAVLKKKSFLNLETAEYAVNL